MVKPLPTLGLMFLVIGPSLGALQSFRMQSSYLCPGKVLNSTYRYSTLVSRSSFDCVSQCRSDEMCVSAVYDASSRSCHLGNQIAGDACVNMVAVLGRQKFYQIVSPCLNGGKLNILGKCVCINSYVGPICSRFMRDCDEGYSSGFFSNNGVYNIQPNDVTQPFAVVCWMIDKNVRNGVFTRQRTGSMDGNRTWAEYKQGFGNLDTIGEYWLGLEKIYRMTTSNTYQLRARILLENGTIIYFNYNNFVLNDESRGYSVASNSTVRGSGDCITDSVGSPFSTYDRVNDNSSSSNNCAARMGGGWWYSGAACSRCNLLGPNMLMDEFSDSLPASVAYYLVLS